MSKETEDRSYLRITDAEIDLIEAVDKVLRTVASEDFSEEIRIVPGIKYVYSNVGHLLISVPATVSMPSSSEGVKLNLFDIQYERSSGYAYVDARLPGVEAHFWMNVGVITSTDRKSCLIRLLIQGLENLEKAALDRIRSAYQNPPFSVWD